MVVLWTALGLIVGGALNVLISRLPTWGGRLAAPLCCHACHHPLATRDVLPLAGFTLQRGRCRYCGAPLSWRFPLVEAATALLFALAYLRFGLAPTLPVYSFYLAVLLLVFVIDLRHRLILNIVTYPAAIIALVLAAVTPGLSLPSAAFGGLIYGGFFALLYLVAALLYRRGDALGMGDVKLAFVIGIMAGLPRGIVALVLGVLLGAVSAVFVLAAGRSAKSAMPYGTALGLGAMVALLYGDLLAVWYIGQ